MTLNEFMDSSVRNAWLDLDIPMELFARKSQRIVNKEKVKAFDVANVVVFEENRSQGVFSNFMIKLEDIVRQAGLDGIFVESIQEPRLSNWLERNGFIRAGNDCDICPNYYKAIYPRLIPSPSRRLTI